MNILPYKYLELKTNLTADEVQHAIEISCKKWSFSSAMFSSHKKPFFGEVDNNKFEIYRHIKYGNSFLPIAYGRIEADGLGSKIIIRISLSASAILFMIVWFAIGFKDGIPSIHEYQGLKIFIPFSFFIYGYALMSFGFWFEVPKLIRLIKKTLGL